MKYRMVFVVAFMTFPFLDLGAAADANASRIVASYVARGAQTFARMIGYSATPRMPTVSMDRLQQDLDTTIEQYTGKRPADYKGTIEALMDILGTDYEYRSALERLRELPHDMLTQADSVDLYKFFLDATETPTWPLCMDHVVCLSSPEKMTLRFEDDGAVTRWLELQPEKFTSVYRRVSLRRLEDDECKSIGEICLSKDGVSFGVSCGDASVTVTTKGQVTLSNKHGKIDMTFGSEREDKIIAPVEANTAPLDERVKNLDKSLTELRMDIRELGESVQNLQTTVQNVQPALLQAVQTTIQRELAANK